MTQKLIYFLCTGNSCRSQMAEGFGKQILGADWEVKSAGVEAHGLNPGAVRAMAEVGIDISSQTSDRLDLDTMNRADLIVTLCRDAADRCPATPPSVRREHWGFDDPAKASGTPEQIEAEFRRVRDEIGERIRTFAEEEGR